MNLCCSCSSSLHTRAAFHSITGHCVSLSKNCLFILFAHFSLELFVFFLYHLCESFAIVVLWALHFHSYMIASASAFAQSVFLFLVRDVCVLCENHKFLWSIYSKFFKYLVFQILVFNQIELIFIYSMRLECVFILLCMENQLF